MVLNEIIIFFLGGFSVLSILFFFILFLSHKFQIKETEITQTKNNFYSNRKIVKPRYIYTNQTNSQVLKNIPKSNFTNSRSNLSVLPNKRYFIYHNKE